MQYIIFISLTVFINSNDIKFRKNIEIFLIIYIIISNKKLG